jgi:glycosyltransferase involved in cell wall biosynthesis
MRPLRILTWHVHGSYLFNLVQAQQEFYLPVKPGLPEGYGGRSGNFAWPDNVHDVPAEQVRDLSFDVVVYQSRKNYLQDQHEILSRAQQKIPRIYLEHDPPREHPTDTRHPADDHNMLLVHVTPFNDLMWDSGRTPTRVIDHGVLVPEGVSYSGEIERGIVVVNDLRKRGRRLGLDVFDRVRCEVPLDLAGMGSEQLGGLGDIPHKQLAYQETQYRFFFNPIRYTSLGFAVCEAMMLGMPIIALATTEMATVIENGVSGYADTDVGRLMERMKDLLADRDGARRLGEGARSYALERFNMRRFIADWNDALALVTGKRMD